MGLSSPKFALLYQIARKERKMAELMEYRLLSGVAGVRHGVSVRDPSRPLDFSLALHTGQAAEAVLANRRELEERFGPGSLFVSVLQVHGDGIHVVERGESYGWREPAEGIRADALLTDLPGVVLTILTADCVPILLCDPVRKVVGAVHAGWKGSRLEILRKTVEEMERRFGSDPGEILAAIGPAIGRCCYEVGPEVAEHFTEVEGAVVPGEGERFMLDLKAVNRSQLLEAGLKDAHIETSPGCTACESDRFFSYRKEGGCDGRFMSCIMLES
jgi:YfiH family protein